MTVAHLPQVVAAAVLEPLVKPPPTHQLVAMVVWVFHLRLLALPYLGLAAAAAAETALLAQVAMAAAAQVEA